MRALILCASFGFPEFSLGPNVFPIDAIWERTNDPDEFMYEDMLYLDR